MSALPPESSEGVGANRSSQSRAPKEVTHLLEGVANGETEVRDELYRAVYTELRAMAARKMSFERSGHTLQPTALVHEAWLRFGGQTFTNRAHFFAAAAEAMRRILVDSARRRNQIKRGGEYERVEFSEAFIAGPVRDERLLMVDDALDALAREDPLKSEIVKLRYFVGLSHEEIAQVLLVNEKTVRRHWELAKLRLYQLIAPDSDAVSLDGTTAG